MLRAASRRGCEWPSPRCLQHGRKALSEAHGTPEMIRSDNGREFIAETVKTIRDRAVCTPVFIAKGRPQQNCYVERFNGSMRDEATTGRKLRDRPLGPRRADQVGPGVQTRTPSPEPEHADAGRVPGLLSRSPATGWAVPIKEVKRQ